MKIIADTHTHTVASCHAYSTLLENVAQAKKMGLSYLAMTDHGPTLPDSPHVWHFMNLRIVPSEIDGIQVLKGVEANLIDFEGSIDIPKEILRTLDWVIVSFHNPSCAPGTVQQHTNAYLNALKNPYVDVLGHSGTEDYVYDYDLIARECQKAGKLIEINEASSKIRDGAKKNCAEIAKACKKYGTNVVLSTDSHFTATIGRFDHSLEMLASIDFPETQIINADEQRFADYLQRRKLRLQ